MLDVHCIHDVSDEDCNKCMVYGLIYCCPEDCKEFRDSVYKCSKEEASKKRRELFYEQYGVKL